MNTAKDIKKALLFVLTTYFFSWSIFIFANANVLLMTLGACMPSIVGIMFIILSKSGANKDLRKRIFNFKLIGLPWYLIIIFILPVFFFLSLIILKFLGEETPNLDKMFQVLSNPALVALLVIYTGVGAGVGEEFGWRGYLLDLLQKRFNALVSSLIVGVFWAAWHIPLRLLQKVSLFSVDYIADFVMIVSFSLLITWIYNNNNRSILSAILTHCMINSSLAILGGAKPLPPNMNVVITLFIVILVIVMSLFCKPYSIFKNDSFDLQKDSVPNV